MSPRQIPVAALGLTLTACGQPDYTGVWEVTEATRGAESVLDNYRFERNDRGCRVLRTMRYVFAGDGYLFRTSWEEPLCEGRGAGRALGAQRLPYEIGDDGPAFYAYGVYGYRSCVSMGRRELVCTNPVAGQDTLRLRLTRLADPEGPTG